MNGYSKYVAEAQVGATIPEQTILTKLTEARSLARVIENRLSDTLGNGTTSANLTDSPEPYGLLPIFRDASDDIIRSLVNIAEQVECLISGLR